MNTGLKRLLNVKELMALWGVSRTWVYDAAARGEIPSIRLGSMLRFDSEEVDSWLRQHRNRAPGEVVRLHP